MDIDQLTAFDRIVREGSFSRAAWSLQIAQPTISARLRALEQEVGGPLLSRTNRHVRLTPRGERFLPYARRALDVLDEGVAAAHQASDGARGRVSIGVLGSLSAGVLAPTLAALHRDTPQREYYVRAGSHQKTLELLSDGVVELALLTWPCLEPPRASLEPLLRLREPVALVVPAAHPLAGRGAVRQADLPRWCDPLLLVRWWQVTPPPLAQLAAAATAVANVPPDAGRALLCDGIGIGFFTHTLVGDLLATGVLAELPLADMAPLARETALVRLARATPLSAAAQRVVTCLREQAIQRGLLLPG